MEKRLLILIFVLVSVGFMCLAVAQGSDGYDSYSDAESEELRDVSGDTHILEEGTEKVRGGINQGLEKSVIVPENLQIFARILFGIKGEIKVRTLILLITLWIIIFMVILNGLEIAPLFGEGWHNFIAALAITCVIALSGAIRSLAIFFFNLGNAFEFLEKWPILNIVIVVILLILFFAGLKVVLSYLERWAKEQRGEDVGSEMGILARAASSFVDRISR